jgi:hypothetical protein
MAVEGYQDGPSLTSSEVSYVLRPPAGCLEASESPSFHAWALLGEASRLSIILASLDFA